MRNSPENAYDMRALCVARISVAIAKVSLASPESMQHMFNLWCMGHGIPCMGFCFIRDQSFSYIYDICKVISQPLFKLLV